MNNPVVKGGVYRHYKGPLYRLIEIVRHSETLEEMAFYETLHDNELGRFWVRPKDMFFGMQVLDGKEVLRFQHVPEEAKNS